MNAFPTAAACPCRRASPSCASTPASGRSPRARTWSWSWQSAASVTAAPTSRRCVQRRRWRRSGAGKCGGGVRFGSKCCGGAVAQVKVHAGSSQREPPKATLQSTPVRLPVPSGSLRSMKARVPCMLACLRAQVLPDQRNIRRLCVLACLCPAGSPRSMRVRRSCWWTRSKCGWGAGTS